MDLYPGQLGISCFPRPYVSPPLVSHLSLEPSFASRFAVSGLTPLKPPTAGDSAVRHPTCVSVRITSRCPGLKVGPPPRSQMGREAAFILAIGLIGSRSRDSPAPAALDRRPLGGSSSLEEQRWRGKIEIRRARHSGWKSWLELLCSTLPLSLPLCLFLSRSLSLSLSGNSDGSSQSWVYFAITVLVWLFLLYYDPVSSVGKQAGGKERTEGRTRREFGGRAASSRSVLVPHESEIWSIWF